MSPTVFFATLILLCIPIWTLASYETPHANDLLKKRVSVHPSPQAPSDQTMGKSFKLSKRFWHEEEDVATNMKESSYHIDYSPPKLHPPDHHN
ncbi:hypothetical protein GOP47_0007602 [Adiantum capillus-veneris]|uniref:Uncharacterized protein n=1 Tax=Adiantum capillus-veneris TaxID=13818 RepID=A0A9D4V1W7_ADICA|nr:hypothetical protein GOP47_0007602 [Adiantum capillus-veneris]